jgi:hypothetical protein
MMITQLVPMWYEAIVSYEAFLALLGLWRKHYDLRQLKIGYIA